MGAGHGSTGMLPHLQWFDFERFLIHFISYRGCVSGAQIANIRRDIGTDGKDEYDWEAIDGYDELK